MWAFTTPSNASSTLHSCFQEVNEVDLSNARKHKFRPFRVKSESNRHYTRSCGRTKCYLSPVSFFLGLCLIESTPVINGSSLAIISSNGGQIPSITGKSKMFDSFFQISLNTHNELNCDGIPNMNDRSSSYLSCGYYIAIRMWGQTGDIVSMMNEMTLSVGALVMTHTHPCSWKYKLPLVIVSNIVARVKTSVPIDML